MKQVTFSSRFEPAHTIVSAWCNTGLQTYRRTDGRTNRFVADGAL